MNTRTIIAGSRTLTDYGLFVATIEQYDLWEVVWGFHTEGVDCMVSRYLAEHSELWRKAFPADWRKYGKAAGPLRNREMAEYAAQMPHSRLIALWDGKTSGTANMAAWATVYGLEVNVILQEGK